MTYALYADDMYVDDIASARGILDLHSFMLANEPDHPLTNFMDSMELSLPEDSAEQVDIFMELNKLDVHGGEPIDSTIARLLQGLRTAFSKSPRTIILSDGLGDLDPQPVPPPTEQDMEREITNQPPPNSSPSQSQEE